MLRAEDAVLVLFFEGEESVELGQELAEEEPCVELPLDLVRELVKEVLLFFAGYCLVLVILPSIVEEQLDLVFELLVDVSVAIEHPEHSKEP